LLLNPVTELRADPVINGVGRGVDSGIANSVESTAGLLIGAGKAVGIWDEDPGEARSASEVGLAFRVVAAAATVAVRFEGGAAANVGTCLSLSDVELG
jgi:2-keto-3-deoxy-L-rhamnonate aldolase RhmA